MRKWCLRFSRLSSFVAGFTPFRMNKNVTTRCVMNAMKHPQWRFHQILHMRICVGRTEKEGTMRNSYRILSRVWREMCTSDLCTWKLGKYIDHKEICCEVFASILLPQDGFQNSALLNTAMNFLFSQNTRNLFTSHVTIRVWMSSLLHGIINKFWLK
jgi:hypothetical protein